MVDLRFVYPDFLFALSLIAIPILVHLFNFRRFRKVPFTNVRFLKDITEESSYRSKLKHLLVLMARILALSFLVMAFAQPYIHKKNTKSEQGNTAVSIYVDNSFSMESVSRDGPLIDIAREKAMEIAGSYRPSDKFQIITNDFNPVHQRFYTRDEFMNLTETVTIGPFSRSFSEITARQSDAFEMSGISNRHSFLISDFQNSMNDGSYIPDSLVNTTLLKLDAARSPNVSIDSVWFSSPVIQKGEPAEIIVRLRSYNHADELSTSVTLTIDGVQRAVAESEIDEAGVSEISMTFTPANSGWYRGEVGIEDSPILFDNIYYFSFHIREKLNMLVLHDSEPSENLSALFGGTGTVVADQINFLSVNYSEFSKMQVLVLYHLNTVSSGLASELSKFIDQGGTLIVVPDSTIDMESYSDFSAKIGVESYRSENRSEERVEYLETDDVLFEGVFENVSSIGLNTELPVVNYYYSLSGQSNIAKEDLIVLQSDNPVLSRYTLEKGQVYLFCIPFYEEFSNFTRHSLFVPVLFRAAILSRLGQKVSYVIGKNDYFEVTFDQSVYGESYKLVNSEIEFDIIPGVKKSGNSVQIYTGGLPHVAGHYDFLFSDSLISVLSFNFNRDESVMAYLSRTDLEDLGRDIGGNSLTVLGSDDRNLAQIVQTESKGIGLWKYCIILVLIFLITETLLLKYFKG